MVNKLTLEEINRLSLRNLDLLNNNWKESEAKVYANLAYLDARGLNSDFLAYHVASPNQNMLAASRFSSNINLSLEHIFFSTDKEDLEFYLEDTISNYLHSNSSNMVYFSDLRCVHQARIQISYKSPVMFQDDISKKEQEYKQGELREADLEVAYQDWIRKYTKLFNPNRLKRIFNNKRGPYILLKEEIKVIKD